MVRNQPQENPLGFVGITCAIERESQLFTNHRRSRQRRSHARHQRDHFRPCLDVAIRQKKVGDDTRLGFTNPTWESRNFLLNGAHRSDSTFPGSRQTRPDLLYVPRAVRKDIGLQPLHIWTSFHWRTSGAVRLPFAGGVESCNECGAIALRPRRLAVRTQLVRQARQTANVDWRQSTTFREN
jgi:hypothetical protein